jgi:three-Cys-motif partner protein
MRKFGGSWSESKLSCIEGYALSYLQVMQKQYWCTLDYVDAFAGRGKHALKSGVATNADVRELDSFFGDESERADTEEFLVGSALRALRASEGASRPFDRFLFIDADDASCSELELVIKSEFPEMRGAVEVICGDANNKLREYSRSVNWNCTRALVFLDPYGLEVNWNLIIHLAETGACDVWYLFPLGGVIRMMTNDGQVPDSWRKRLNRVFGTEFWYEEFYRSGDRQLTLFGDDQEEISKNASTEHVVDFIRQRLLSVFPAVSNAGILRNGKGAPLFALVLGVSNPKATAQKAALRIANHLVKDLSK